MNQESRVPELLNKTVVSKKNLRFCETNENVDFVAEIVIAEGEIEGFRYKIDGYQDKINRLRQLERKSGQNGLYGRTMSVTTFCSRLYDDDSLKFFRHQHRCSRIHFDQNQDSKGRR